MLQIGVAVDLRQDIRSGLPDTRPGLGQLFFRHADLGILRQGQLDALINGEGELILGMEARNNQQENNTDPMCYL
ncbi:MAG: hypothetical protein BWY77_00849 [bacterium ADurb.Bin431]|nr:MAG: hypothetical protein BWY77_00849 [bacterium ADurb.Bin431]